MKSPRRTTRAARKAGSRASKRKPASKKASKPAARKKTAPVKRAGPPKMKAYASFDLYLADQPPKNQRLIGALRQFVARAAPELAESVKWGNGCWLQGKGPIAYVYSAPDYVQFGFIRGSALADPRGLLEGQGQYVRHVKVRQARDIDEPAFTALLRQAIRLGPPSR